MNLMKKGLLLFAAGVCCATLAPAATTPQSGTVISENSVNCGTKGGKKSLDLLCQDYVVRTTSVEYHIRQQKPGDKALVPVNTTIDFTIDKDKIKFKIDGKSYEYVIVSEAAISAAQTPAN
jgi:hypothetical protein